MNIICSLLFPCISFNTAVKIYLASYALFQNTIFQSPDAVRVMLPLVLNARWRCGFALPKYTKQCTHTLQVFSDHSLDVVLMVLRKLLYTGAHLVYF